MWKHSFSSVAAVSFALGSLASIAFVGAFVQSSLLRYLSAYFGLVAVFHFLEYLMVAIHNPTKLSMDCTLPIGVDSLFCCFVVLAFLLNHSNEYSVAFAAAIIEFIFEALFFDWKSRLAIVKFLGTGANQSASEPFMMRVRVYVRRLGCDCRPSDEDVRSIDHKVKLYAHCERGEDAVQ